MMMSVLKLTILFAKQYKQWNRCTYAIISINSVINFASHNFVWSFDSSVLFDGALYYNTAGLCGEGKGCTDEIALVTLVAWIIVWDKMLCY